MGATTNPRQKRTPTQSAVITTTEDFSAFVIERTPFELPVQPIVLPPFTESL